MNLKKSIYILATIILGLILSMIVHAFIEMWLIDRMLAANNLPKFQGRINCFLPNYLRIGLPIMGVIGGYFLGQTWWRIVYVEKRHWRFKKVV